MENQKTLLLPPTAAMFTKNTNLLLTLAFLLPLCRASLPSDKAVLEVEFSYKHESGAGPGDWGKIHPNWTVCEKGAIQSPIDFIHSEVVKAPELGDLQRDYKKAPASIQNTGRDIIVKWHGDAGTFNINGTVFDLKQIHWHSPSEHTFNGASRALEAHMVHETPEGKTAVVGITYIYGKPDPFLNRIIPELPDHLNEKERNIGTVDPTKIKLGSKSYYRYIGSRTVPPCTEGVIWTVIKKPITASEEQVKKLKAAVRYDFQDNARPVQHPKGRKILLFAHAIRKLQ